MEKKAQKKKKSDFQISLDTIHKFLREAETFVPNNKRKDLRSAQESLAGVYEHFYALRPCFTEGTYVTHW